MKRLAAHVEQLRMLIRVHDGTRSARKRALLSKLSRRSLDDPVVLKSLHDILLFMAAFPDDAAMLGQVGRLLRRIGPTVSKLIHSGQTTRLDALHNTGIAGSCATCSLTLDAMKWLADRFGSAVELMWDKDSLGESFDEFIPLIMSPTEQDGLLDSRWTARQWITRACGRQRDLPWLLRQIAARRAAGHISPALFDRTFDPLELQLRWTLKDRIASRTTARFPARPICFGAGNPGDSIETLNAEKVLSLPLPAAKRLSRTQSRAVIDLARAALAVRQRETDPVTYADPRVVRLYQLERGIDVLILGLEPRRRLPIESYFGYVAAKNRMPMAYGGGWIGLGSCTVGINIFDEYRGGESAFLFSQIMRVYRQLFDVPTFFVDPYQFGENNPEAVRSGAFWFYYRLGFRPTERTLAVLAQQEAARIAGNRMHRTSPRLLRRLATGRLRKIVKTGSHPLSAPIDSADLSMAVTRWISRRFDGDRIAAEDWGVRRAATILNVKDLAKWGADEQQAFRNLAPLAAMIGDLHRWPTPERRQLARLMRAKGGTGELEYARLLNRHERFVSAMRLIANQGIKRG